MASKANGVVGFDSFHLRIQETCVDVQLIMQQALNTVDILSGELQARDLG